MIRMNLTIQTIIFLEEIDLKEEEIGVEVEVEVVMTVLEHHHGDQEVVLDKENIQVIPVVQDVE